MVNIYPWPPVPAIGKFWNLDQPISKSYSMTSGRRYASKVMTPRRRAKIIVYGRRDYALGYMAALERLLEGGVHLVRLTSCRLTFGPVGEFPNGRGGSFEFGWRETSVASTEFKWQVPDPEFIWYDGIYAYAGVVAGSGGTTIALNGELPVNQIIAVPGEFITIHTALNPGGEKHMVTNVAVSGNSQPRVTLKLATPVSGPGRINLNTSEVGLFELNSDFPDLGRSGAEIPDIELSFRQVFANEVSEGFTEVNPWS